PLQKRAWRHCRQLRRSRQASAAEFGECLSRTPKIGPAMAPVSKKCSWRGLFASAAGFPSCSSRFVAHSLLEQGGFELVWGFPCQVVFFGLLPVLCSEREGAVLHPVAYDQVPGARAMGSRDRNASKAWRLAALAALAFGSALRPEHAEGR